LLAEKRSDVVLNLNLDGLIVWASPSARDSLQWHPKDLVGQRNVGLVHPDDLQAFIGQARSAVQTGAGSRMRFRIMCGDGSWRWVEATGKQVPATDHASASRVVHIRDVHDQQRALDAPRRSEKCSARQCSPVRSAWRPYPPT